METKLLSVGMGFLVLYLVGLKCARTGREDVDLYREVHCMALMSKIPLALLQFETQPATVMNDCCMGSGTLCAISCKMSPTMWKESCSSPSVDCVSVKVCAT